METTILPPGAHFTPLAPEEAFASILRGALSPGYDEAEIEKIERRVLRLIDLSGGDMNCRQVAKLFFLRGLSAGRYDRDDLKVLREHAPALVQHMAKAFSLKSWGEFMRHDWRAADMLFALNDPTLDASPPSAEVGPLVVGGFLALILLLIGAAAWALVH